MILCKRADGKSLADAIIRLKNNKELTQSLAENSFNYFNENLKPNIIVSDLVKSFE